MAENQFMASANVFNTATGMLDVLLNLGRRNL